MTATCTSYANCWYAGNYGTLRGDFIYNTGPNSGSSSLGGTSVTSGPCTSNIYSTSAEYTGFDSSSGNSRSPVFTYITTGCTACPAGTSGALGISAAAQCVTCLAGTAAAAGSATCANCPAGTFSGAGAASCSNCPAGSYSSSSTSFSCSVCPAGTYSPTSNSIACTPCVAGTWSGAGASACSGCQWPVAALTNAAPLTFGAGLSAGHWTASFVCAAGYFAVPFQMTCDVTSGALSNLTSPTCAACTAPTAFSGVANINTATANYGGNAAVWQYTCQAGSFGNATLLACNNTASSSGYALLGGVPTPANANGSFYGAAPNCTACNALGGGYYCNGGTDVGGPQGLGRYICASGTYSGPPPAPSASTPACNPCLGGYYCPNNGTTVNNYALCGQSTFYCPSGTSAPLGIPPGHYGTPVGTYISAYQSTTSGQFSGTAICPTTEICGNGLIQPPVDFSLVCGAPSGGSLTIGVSNGVTNAAFGPALTPATPNPTGVPLALTYYITNAVALDSSCTGIYGVAALLSGGGLNVASNLTATPGLVFLSSGAQLFVNSGYTFNSQFCPSGFRFTLTAVRQATPSLNATCAITVSLQQSILVPTFTVCGNVSVTEHSGAGAATSPAIVATSGNYGTEINFAIAGAPGIFQISPCTGVITSTVDLAWTAASSYPLVIAATNNGQSIGLGTAVGYCSLFVNVLQRVLPPAPTVTAFLIPELSSVGTWIGNLQVVDPAGYAIKAIVWGAVAAPNAVSVDGLGNLTVAQVVDTLVLLKTVWNYVVNVTNSYNVMASYAIIITFASVPRPPIVTAQSVSIAENATAGTAASPALLASSPGGIAMTYAISPATVFSVDANTGVLTINPGQSLHTSTFPPAAQVLTLTCSSAGGSSSAQVTVVILEVPLAPVFNTKPAAWAFTVSEGAAAGTDISLAVQAHALLANPAYSTAATTYALLSVSPSPAAYTPFAIAPTTGDVLVGPALNGPGNSLLFDSALVYPYSQGMFQLTVAAVDRSGMFSTGVVNVTIINIKPRPSAVTFNISLASVAGGFVANVSTPAIVYTSPTYNRSNLRFFIAPISTPNVNNAALQAAGVPAFVMDPVAGVMTVAPGVTGTSIWNFAAQRSYSVTYMACDAVVLTLCGSAVMTVNLVHVNQVPVWLAVSPPIYATEQVLGPAGLPLSSFVFDADTAVDVAPPEAFTFAIAGGNTLSTFGINSATGQLSAIALTTALVYSTTASPFQLNVSVTDAGIDGPRYTVFATITVSVTPNQAPPVLASFALNVVEHSTVGSLAYAGPGIGAGTAILGSSPACPPSPAACPGSTFAYSLTPTPSGDFPFNITVLNTLPLASAQIALTAATGGAVPYWQAGAPASY